MKIGDFQKCKIHSSSLRGFRITACQSWCNSQKVKKSTVFIGGAVFVSKDVFNCHKDLSTHLSDF